MCGPTQAIDSLVSQETHGYIPKLFEPDTLDASTRLVLTDAVYLNATWATPFDPNLTTPSGFHPAAGPTTAISLMNRTGEYDYASGKGWQLVELPYVGVPRAIHGRRQIGTNALARSGIAAGKMSGSQTAPMISASVAMEALTSLSERTSST